MTEEKCAVLFSTTVALSPSNLTVHLQVPAPLLGSIEPPSGTRVLPPVAALVQAGMALGRPQGCGRLSPG